MIAQMLTKVIFIDLFSLYQLPPSFNKSSKIVKYLLLIILQK